MNKTTTPEQNWQNQKAELMLLFPFLIETDFYFDYGKKEVMMMSLQVKLQKTREELNELLSQSIKKEVN
jgi:hypothetical protein